MTSGKQFREAINEAFEHLSKEGLDAVSKRLDDLRATRGSAQGIQQGLDEVAKDISAHVGNRLRVLMPHNRAEVVLSGNGFMFRYHARSIKVTPNLENRTWEVAPENTPHGLRFTKALADELTGTPLEEWEGMIQKIATRFARHYQTLRDVSTFEIPDDEPAPTIPDDVIASAIGEEPEDV